LADGTIEHTLWVTNDNDFVPGTAGPDQFFVFGFQDSDLSSLAQMSQSPHMGNDDSRLRRHWLHGLSSEVKASTDGRLIHQHRV
jgi:hypothetical protein